jgi:hypothetical protein
VRQLRRRVEPGPDRHRRRRHRRRLRADRRYDAAANGYNPTQTDTDGDGTGDACENPDMDSDGRTDPQERWTGHTVSDGCPDVTGASGHRAWPFDTDNSRTLNVNDLLGVPSFKSSFGANMANPLYNRRFDFDASGTINVNDLLGVNGFKDQFGQTCVNQKGYAVSFLGSQFANCPGAVVDNTAAEIITCTWAGACPGASAKVGMNASAVRWGGGDDADTVSASASCSNATAGSPVTATTTAGTNVRTAVTNSTISNGAGAAGNLVCTFNFDTGDANDNMRAGGRCFSP